MRVGDEIELVAGPLVAGGDALSRAADGRVVFVSGAVAGERVRARVQRVRRDFLNADVTAVIDASADRVTPPCRAVARGCGGCSWQHVTPAGQHAAKVELVTDAFRRLGRLGEPIVVAGAAVDPARTTVRLAVDHDGRLAYRRTGSHDLIAVDDCLVLHPELERLVVASRWSGSGEVLLRVSEFGTGATAWPLDGVQARPPLDGVEFGPEASITEFVNGVRLEVRAASFFQSSASAAAALVDAVTAEVLDGPHPNVVIDAYAGVGLFSATLAAPLPNGRFVAVESNPAATADAAVNLAGIDAAIVTSAVEHWRAPAADLVIADPARAGLGRSGVEALAASAADTIILVSCDAAAGARDSALLAEAGYWFVRATVLDLFPHTAHVEVVSRFERRG